MTGKWLEVKSGSEQLYRLHKTPLQVAAYEDHSDDPPRRMSVRGSFDSSVFNPRPQYRGEWLGLQPLKFTEPGLGLSHTP